MSFIISDVFFVIISGLTILSALGVVFSRNIIHSALFLILAFLGVAGIFFELGAGFIGLVQILVYAGAISVLIIFAIMLVMNTDVKKTNMPNPNIKTHLWGVYLAALLTIALGASIWYSDFPQVKGLAVSDAVGSLAELMLGSYVVAFEVAAVLLLLAVVGAIILSRGVEEE
jgi:NADH-quinone oxidoreductase subunit J